MLIFIDLYYAPPLIGGGIKRCFCLTSVCLTSVAYIGAKSRTERPRNRLPKLAEIAHVTRDSDTTFKVKGHQTALLSAALMHKATAAVSVGTYSAWELDSIATLHLLGGAPGAIYRAPTGRGAGAYCVATRTACFVLLLI